MAVSDDDTSDRWVFPGHDVGWSGPESLEFVFGPTRLDRLIFDGKELAPDDPRLVWFDLAGTVADGGPFPPHFEHSPYLRRSLLRRPRPDRFTAPFSYGNGLPEIVQGGRRMRLPVALRDPSDRRILHFVKAHADFFACGETPVLHAVSDEGVVEWFATDDLLRATAADPVAGHGYDAPLGRLLGGQRRGIAVGRIGFATVADDRPIWVRATPFGMERQSRAACACDRALGAPIAAAADFVWPVLSDGRVRVVRRPDAVGGDWSFHPVEGDGPAAAFRPPCRLAGNVVVWVAEEGYLIGRDAEWKWCRWPPGYRALPAHGPYVDIQGNAWQFGTAASGYAFAKLSSGRQDLAPTTGHHVGGVHFTVQGNDVLDRPARDDTGRRVLRANDGKLVVPVLTWEDGAVVAVSALPASSAPEAFFTATGATTATFTYRLLAFADLGLSDLGAGLMKWTHRRDLQAFVFADHLFLTSSWETRCVVFAA
jgi:hypothetical protein